MKKKDEVDKTSRIYLPPTTQKETTISDRKLSFLFGSLLFSLFSLHSSLHIGNCRFRIKDKRE